MFLGAWAVWASGRIRQSQAKAFPKPEIPFCADKIIGCAPPDLPFDLPFEMNAPYLLGCF